MEVGGGSPCTIIALSGYYTLNQDQDTYIITPPKYLGLTRRKRKTHNGIFLSSLSLGCRDKHYHYNHMCFLQTNPPISHLSRAEIVLASTSGPQSSVSGHTIIVTVSTSRRLRHSMRLLRYYCAGAHARARPC